MPFFNRIEERLFFDQTQDVRLIIMENIFILIDMQKMDSKE